MNPKQYENRFRVATVEVMTLADILRKRVEVDMSTLPSDAQFVSLHTRPFLRVIDIMIYSREFEAVETEECLPKIALQFKTLEKDNA